MSIRVDNYVIETPLIEIVQKLQLLLNGRKLRDVREKADEIIVTCPFHGGGVEAVPDLHILTVEKDGLQPGVFHCFACGTSGDFVKFVAGCFDSAIDYAKQWLIDNYGSLAYSTIPLSDDIAMPNSKKVKTVLDGSELDGYQNWCSYMAKRGILYETAKKFNVKYDPYRRQVVFPIYDEKDDLVMIAKRSIDTKMFFMTEDVEKPLYCFNNIIKNHEKTAMVVEGLFDCLKGNQFGIPTFATLGEIADEQVDKINNSEITHLYLCFDNDSAGRRFNAYMKSKLAPRILLTDVILPPGKKDIGELNYDEFKKIIENL